MIENNYLNLSEFINKFQLDMVLNNNLYEEFFEDWEVENLTELTSMFIEDITEDLTVTETEKTQINNIIQYDFLNTRQKERLLDHLNIDYLLKKLILYYDYEILENPTSNINKEILTDYYWDHFHELEEVYQYFIVPEYQIRYWEKYTTYPIFYNYHLDLYLIGIQHYGISWRFINTTYKK